MVTVTANPRPDPWQNRVRFGAGSTAYRPHQLLVSTASDAQSQQLTLDRVTGALARLGIESAAEVAQNCIRLVLQTQREFDILALTTLLRGEGVDAQPNHVLFADTSFQGNPFYGNPFYGNPFYGNPFYGNPFYGNPFYGNPFYGNPFYGNPFYGNPVDHRSDGSGRCMARATPSAWPTLAAPPADAVRVAVLDVGLPASRLPPGAVWFPGAQVPSTAAADPPASPDPDENGDGFTDRAAGHGLFIAGRILQASPEARVEVYPVLFNDGDGDEWTVIRHLESLVSQGQASVDIVNLSLSGYAIEDMTCLRRAIASLQCATTPRGRKKAKGATVPNDGVAVVASAGNDGCQQAPYPAALPGVISVGALSAHGPAPFSNYGPWVRASAYGADVLSSYFMGWSGPEPAQPGGDPDNFIGTARWSGTSFAAPFVAGRIAAVMREHDLTPTAAADRLLDQQDLARLPGYGTVVT